MNNKKWVIRDILLEAQEDYVGLWSIVRRIRETKIADDSNILPVTLEVLDELLSTKDIVAGNFGSTRYPETLSPPTFVKHDFHIWSIPKTQIINEIDREWKTLGRDPILGEVVWIVAIPPDKSRRLQAERWITQESPVFINYCPLG